MAGRILATYAMSGIFFSVVRPIINIIMHVRGENAGARDMERINE